MFKEWQEDLIVEPFRQTQRQGQRPGSGSHRQCPLSSSVPSEQKPKEERTFAENVKLASYQLDRTLAALDEIPTVIYVA